MINKFNEINNKYGKLTVVARAPNYKNGSAQWYCICDCGNLDKIKVRASSLRDGHTKSCGCLVSEITKQIHSGKFVSNETRQKMSKSLSGQIHLESRSDLGRKYPDRGKYNRGSLIVRKVNSIINNAKRRNLEWNITKEYAASLLVLSCYYCNKESVLDGHKTCSGIDRINNDFGYIDGNCVPCCFYCNSCKNSRSLTEFKDHIKNMYNTLIMKENNNGFEDD